MNTVQTWSLRYSVHNNLICLTVYNTGSLLHFNQKIIANYYLLISDLRCSLGMQKLHTLRAVFLDFHYYLMDMKLAFKSKYWGDTDRRFENLVVHILSNLHIIKYKVFVKNSFDSKGCFFQKVRSISDISKHKMPNLSPDHKINNRSFLILCSRERFGTFFGDVKNRLYFLKKTIINWKNPGVKIYTIYTLLLHLQWKNFSDSL